MKKLITLVLTLSLVGCFGPTKFDSTSDESIEASALKITESLEDGQKEEFKEAIVYFTIGGTDGIGKMMANAFSDKPSEVNHDEIISNNLKAIHGLTGDEIITKYRVMLEAERVAKEQADRLAEEKKQAEELARKEANRIAEEKRKAEQIEREKVSALLAKAKNLTDSKQYGEALEVYQELTTIPSALEVAKIKIEHTTTEMEEFTAKMAYMDKIEITEFVAKRIDTYLEKDIPAVRIGIKNNGDKSLDQVKVVVYFQDKDGKTIFEEAYHPVLVTQYSISSSKPLKAGYVHEMEKGKYYTLKSALSEWEEGKATIKVVDLEFSE